MSIIRDSLTSRDEARERAFRLAASGVACVAGPWPPNAPDGKEEGWLVYYISGFASANDGPAEQSPPASE